MSLLLLSITFIAVESAEEDTDENGNESDISDEGKSVMQYIAIRYHTYIINKKEMKFNQTWIFVI